MGATRLALAERLRDQTTVLEGSRICCSPPLAPGSAGQQAGFRMQHYESIGALGPSRQLPLFHYDAVCVALPITIIIITTGCTVVP